MNALWLLLWSLFLCRSADAFHTWPQSQHPRSTVVLRKRSTKFLRGRPYRPYQEADSGDDFKKERSAERPTQVETQPLRPRVGPSKPNILVLGASGLIGRRVVKTLLEMPQLDVTVFAFVRDYDKACRVLYDELLVSNSRKKGSKLQIIQGDLIPVEELPCSQRIEDELDEDKGSENEEIAPDEALEQAIRDCSTIISCVGSVRPTNFWTDIIARPVWRLLRKDVSGWCDDPRHPYYVHYHTTRKALKFAEHEQLRREAAASCPDDDDDEDKDEIFPRIRFIRISDLCVAQQPWQFVPLLTNILHSMVFRYQDMAEKALEASSLIETVTLRPGDLVDEERDLNTTALQVGHSGTVPFPARVGRQDVAELAVASALFDSERQRHDDTGACIDDEPFHYTLACRWVGDQMGPYPAQGEMRHGHADAALGLHSALKKLRRGEKRRERRRAVTAQTSPESALRTTRHVKATPRKIKPYFVCTAIPIYLVLSMMLRSLFYYFSPYIPGANYMAHIFSQGTDALALAIGFALRELRALPMRLPKSIPYLHFFRARCGGHYISF